MKLTGVLVFLTEILLFIFGCKKDDISNGRYYSISPDSKNAVIIASVDNIEFRFCLLNQVGEPVTVLKDGQNFSFLFSQTNNRNDSLHLDNSFLMINSRFCTVYSETDSLIGSPFIFKGAFAIGTGGHPFYGNNKSYTVIIPWQDNRIEWETLHCFFEGTNQSLLPKGKYYTQFSHRFCFAKKVDELSLCTDTLTFRINFEIK